MDDLELMLDGPVHQPDWLPRAYADMLCTYMSSTPSDPPVRVLVYHSDGKQSTLLYQFFMGEYTTMFKQEQSHVDIDSVVNIGLLCGTIEGNPHNKKTRTTITKICRASHFDAFYLDVKRDVDEDLLCHITSFAVQYMVHAFYDSIPGRDRAEAIKELPSEGVAKLPLGPYRKDLAEENGQEAKILRFPTRLRSIKVNDDDE